MSHVWYTKDMKDKEYFGVRKMDISTAQTIRELATRHRISQAEVITEAITQFEHDLRLGLIGYPEGWRFPLVK